MMMKRVCSGQEGEEVSEATDSRHSRECDSLLDIDRDGKRPCLRVMHVRGKNVRPHYGDI